MHCRPLFVLRGSLRRPLVRRLVRLELEVGSSLLQECVRQATSAFRTKVVCLIFLRVPLWRTAVKRFRRYSFALSWVGLQKCGRTLGVFLPGPHSLRTNSTVLIVVFTVPLVGGWLHTCRRDRKLVFPRLAAEIESWFFPRKVRTALATEMERSGSTIEVLEVLVRVHFI